MKTEPVNTEKIEINGFLYHLIHSRHSIAINLPEPRRSNELWQLQMVARHFKFHALANEIERAGHNQLRGINILNIPVPTLIERAPISETY